MVIGDDTLVSKGLDVNDALFTGCQVVGGVVE